MSSCQFDPRIQAIKRRLSSVKLVAPVMSPKGGVGKTFISVALALALSKAGGTVGLLDLDLTNPTAHLMLGADVTGTRPVESEGVVPPKVLGVSFMSIAFYSGERPLPLRGNEVDNAIKEILAITRWDGIDILLIDLPPGLSDETLDAVSLLGEVKPIVVTTPSHLAYASTDRLLRLLLEAGVKPLGLVVNMSRGRDDHVVKLCDEFAIKLLGTVPLDLEVDAALGEEDKLLETNAGRAVDKIAKRVLGYL